MFLVESSFIACPLTAVSDDTSFLEVLTANHFLFFWSAQFDVFTQTAMHVRSPMQTQYGYDG